MAYIILSMTLLQDETEEETDRLFNEFEAGVGGAVLEGYIPLPLVITASQFDGSTTALLYSQALYKPARQEQ